VNQVNVKYSGKKLEDLGHRVILIRNDKPLEEQINANADVFGPTESGT
jgi:hypothetical protein